MTGHCCSAVYALRREVGDDVDARHLQVAVPHTGVYCRVLVAEGQFVQYLDTNCAHWPLYQSGMIGICCIRIVCSLLLISLIAAVFVGGVASSCWTSAHAFWFCTGRS